MDTKPGKRKSRMNNIQSRMNSASYDMAKFKANEKDLREKIRFFEKKEEKGELKDYMYGRMQEAKEMYARLLELKSGGPLAPTAAPLAPTAAPFIQSEDMHLQAPETIAAANSQRNDALKTVLSNTLSSAPAQMRITPTNTLPKMTLKKLNKRREQEATALAGATYAAPEFNPPTQRTPKMALPYGEYGNNGEFHVQGTVAPRYNLEGNGLNGLNGVTTFNNLATYRNAVPAVTAPVSTRPTTTRRQRTPVPIYNEYYEQVVPQFLPLPELYDPYTGRKFAPEEDPMPPIESAYDELKEILKRAHLKAASLRKKAARATKRREKAKSKKPKNTTFNAGLRIRLPPNSLTPTGQQLQPQENLFN